MLRCGLDLDGELLALAAASHSGEDFHVAGVRKILARAGLTEDDLQCPRALPREEVFQQEYLREGGEPDRVHMNCSGKHAAMLATCVAAGWPTATYTDPAHPLQVALRQALEGLAGEQSAAVGRGRVRCPRVRPVPDRPDPGVPGAGHRLAGHAGAPGGRRDAGLPGMDVGEPAHGAGADGHRPGPAAQGGGRRRAGVRAGGRPGRGVQDRGRLGPGPGPDHGRAAAPARRDHRRPGCRTRPWTRSARCRCSAAAGSSADPATPGCRTGLQPRPRLPRPRHRLRRCLLGVCKSKHCLIH